uniref:Gag polyprotein n=1 Tax=Aquila chrysaetos chrysaetos TaxID=223781 RepID=A0A663EGE1_AQUCH
IGQSVSQEHKLYLNILQQILRASGCKITEGQIASLLIKVWESRGTLQTRKTLAFGVSENLIMTWRFIYAALVHLEPAVKIIPIQPDTAFEETVCKQAANEQDSDSDNSFVSGRVDSEKEADFYPYTGSTGSPTLTTAYRSLPPRRCLLPLLHPLCRRRLPQPLCPPQPPPSPTHPPQSPGTPSPGFAELKTEPGFAALPVSPSPTNPSNSVPLSNPVAPALQRCRENIVVPSALPLPDFDTKCDNSLNDLGKNTHSLMQRCREKALQQGDTMFTFPVIYKPHTPSQHDSLPHEMIKELRKSIRENGLHNSFTMGLVETIGGTYTMTPWDWKLLMKMLLISAQYSVWQLEYNDLSVEQIMDNLSSGIAIDQNMLQGTGPYITPQAQAALPKQVFDQATHIALMAIQQVPETGQSTTSFASIRQGSQEPYVSFIDCLQAAITQQVENQEAAKALLFQLAYENANTDCQAALKSVKGRATDIGQYIKICQNIGTETHRANMLAAALSQQLNVHQVTVKCFECGKLGHMAKHCPKRQKSKRDKPVSHFCPHCSKGYHWANQHKLKFDKEGNLFQGNYRRGARPGAPQTNRVWNSVEIPEQMFL